jgi:hypothetical protein
MPKRCSLWVALLTCIATSATAQTPDVINWCNRYNRNPMAVARCIHAETPAQTPTTQQSAPAPQQTAPVQQSAPDPYREAQHEGQMKRYLQDRERMLNALEFMSFAGGCQVVPEALAYVLWSWYYRSLYRSPEWQSMELELAPRKENLSTAMIDNAKRAGLDRAKNEGCDYFKEHPEIVAEIREQRDRFFQSSSVH